MKIILWLILSAVCCLAQVPASEMPKDPPGLEILWQSREGTFQQVRYKGITWYRSLEWKALPDGTIQYYWNKMYNEKEKVL